MKTLKLGKIRITYNRIPIELEDVELEMRDLEAIKDMIELGSKAGKECYWSSVCPDHLIKCEFCQNNPKKSHFCEQFSGKP